MNHFFRLLLLLVLTAFTQTINSQPSELELLMDRLVQNYGGEEALRKLDTMTQRWNMVALIRNQTGTDFRQIKAPDQLRVELTYPDKTETQILNRENAYLALAGAPARQVAGMQRDAMRLQQMSLYSPLMLKTMLESIQLVEDGGQPALSLAEGDLQVLFMVNTDTWRIEKVAGKLMTNGKEIRFLTIYSDFTYIDGVLVHRKEDKYAGGVNTASLDLRDITFDADIDDSLFQP